MIIINLLLIMSTIVIVSIFCSLMDWLIKEFVAKRKRIKYIRQIGI